MIPKINNGDSMKDIRENTINKVVDKVNSMNEDIASEGKKFKVDYRVFTFVIVHGGVLELSVDLDPNEFPVRAVVREFKVATNTGTYTPSPVEYNRTTKTMSIETDVLDGKVFVEFWKEV